MTRLRVRGLLLVVGVLMSACGSPSATTPARSVSPDTSAVATSTPAPTPTPTPTPPPAHVFVIVLENRSYQQAMAQPYLAGLAAQYGVATNYQAVAHPSLPNYLAITSGSTWGIRDDGFHALPNSGLTAQLDAAGITWKAYEEGFTGNCFSSPYPYALKHNPFAYYGDRCPSQVVPFSQLQADLAGTMPQFAWLGPDMCHSGHDCSTAIGDRWLSTVVPQITASDAWKQSGTLYITWDESNGFSNQVALLVVAPNLQAHTSGAALDHFALAGTIADQLGVPRQYQSVGAGSVTQAFGITP